MNTEIINHGVQTMWFQLEKFKHNFLIFDIQILNKAPDKYFQENSPVLLFSVAVQTFKLACHGLDLSCFSPVIICKGTAYMLN